MHLCAVLDNKSDVDFLLLYDQIYDFYITNMIYDKLWHNSIDFLTSFKFWKFLIKVQLSKSDPKKDKDKKIFRSCQLGLRKDFPISHHYEKKKY